MLVLSRQEKEIIYIGDNIILTVLSVRGNQVKIGIDAPLDVTILREEVKKREDAKRQYAKDVVEELIPVVVKKSKINATLVPQTVRGHEMISSEVASSIPAERE